MKIGLFGGAFNPIHNGHLHLASCAKYELGLDRVAFIPCYEYAFDTKNLANTWQDRVAMIAMSMDETNNQICLVEIERKTTSYTIDTVREMKELFKKDDLCLILGPDVIYNFKKWKDSDKITQEIKTKYAVKDFEINPLNIRSSMIRERVKNNMSITGLVPERVENYIKEEGLYL